jgi:hypothetical protein
VREAEASHRTAIRLQPDYPEAHCNLGHVLRQQGRFGEAVRLLRRGHELGSRRGSWPYPSLRWLRQCERLVEVDRKLSAVLGGNAEPASAAERLELTSLCQLPCKRLHRTAARLAADAFAAAPEVADDLQSHHRYNAACSAALAAAGQADDAKLLPDRVALALRRQALGWLRADLALYAQLAGRADPRTKEAVGQRLAQWQQDPDFLTVRDPAALDRLAEDERAAWRKLWGEVEALRARASPAG